VYLSKREDATGKRAVVMSKKEGKRIIYPVNLKKRISYPEKLNKE